MMVDIPQNSFYVMVAVVVFLVIATAARYLLAALHPARDYTTLHRRIYSWWWIFGTLFLAMLLGTNATIIFIAFVSFLALKEFLSIVPTRPVDRRVIFWAYLSIPLQYYWVATAQFGMFLLFIPVYIFLLIPVRMVLTGETRGFIKSVGVIIWAIMLTVFSLSHVAYLLVLPVQNSQAGGVGLVLYLLLLAEFNDVTQTVVDKRWGKHKIIPEINPYKTWEGLLSGLVVVMAVGALATHFLTPLTLLQGLGAAFIIGIAAFLGEIVLSTVKRDLQIKQSGSLMPGQGGILDRLDSLVYAAPLFFHYINYLCCAR